MTNLPKKRMRHDYVDNKRLFAEMVTFIEGVNKAKDQGLDREHWPEVPRYVAVAIKNIAEKLSTKANFMGYSYREEMIGDGIENVLKYIHNFNPEKSNNPFGYFTTIISFAFIRRIKAEKKQQYIKYKSTLDHTMNDSLTSEFNTSRKVDHFYDSNEEKYTEFVKNFEKSNKVETVKKNTKKGLERFVDE